NGLLPPRLATAAAAAAPVATVAAAAAAAAEAAFGPGPRFVHRQRASAHLVLIEFRRSLLRLLVGRHFDKREAARAAGRGIAHHAYRFHVAGFAEQLLQFRL